MSDKIEVDPEQIVRVGLMLEGLAQAINTSTSYLESILAPIEALVASITPDRPTPMASPERFELVEDPGTLPYGQEVFLVNHENDQTQPLSGYYIFTAAEGEHIYASTRESLVKSGHDFTLFKDQFLVYLPISGPSLEDEVEDAGH